MSVAERALIDVAEAFGSPARETILHHNRGKHLLELRMIDEALPPGGRVLDVGGGLGVNLLCLAKLRPDASLALVDRFEEYTPGNQMGAAAVGLALMREAGVEVENRDLWPTAALPYADAGFDVVTIFDVVEHFPGHPLVLLREIRRILRTGGHFLLGGPNAASLVKRLKLAAGRHPYSAFDHWTVEPYFSHYREYDPTEYPRLIELAGFETPTVLLSAEPWPTRARAGRPGSGAVAERALAVGIWLTETLAPGLRELVYCRAVR